MSDQRKFCRPQAALKSGAFVNQSKIEAPQTKVAGPDARKRGEYRAY
jgi:hypothetical protein